MIKVEALTVCVNYSDYFRHVAKTNHKLFSKWVVVTDLTDDLTKGVCDEFGLTCIQTNVFYHDGRAFDKAAGMNAGLEHISPDAFVVMLDADIILHPLTARAFECLDWDESTLYGCDRLNCYGFERFMEYMTGPRPESIVIDNWLMNNAGFELGSRICQYYGQVGENGRFRGWLPLGFFQMAHRSSFDKIPDSLGKADHYDIEFARQYPRSKRVLVPEIMALHLESKGSYKSQNWGGRKSPPFQPNVQEEHLPKQFRNVFMETLKNEQNLL